MISSFTQTQRHNDFHGFNKVSFLTTHTFCKTFSDFNLHYHTVLLYHLFKRFPYSVFLIISAVKFKKQPILSIPWRLPPSWKKKQGSPLWSCAVQNGGMILNERLGLSHERVYIVLFFYCRKNDVFFSTMHLAELLVMFICQSQVNSRLEDSYHVEVKRTDSKIYKMSASPQQQTNEWCRISQL